MKIVTNNQLPNCRSSRNDIAAAETIFGPDIGALKAKTTRKKHSFIRPEQYKAISLAIDIMYINAIPFSITLSRNRKYLIELFNSIYNAL